MIWRKLRLALLETKYGSGLLLLACDLIIVAALLRDVIMLRSTSLDYFAVLREDLAASRFDGAALLTTLILLVLPIIVGVLGNFLLFRQAPALYYKFAATTRAKGFLLLFHFSVVAICAFHMSTLQVLQESAGLCGTLMSSSYCFESLFSTVMSLRGYFLLPIGLWFLGLLLKETLYKGGELTREFDFWRLVGAAGQLQPEYGDEIVYVNSASMAPSVKAIGSSTRSLGHQYQKSVPTSDRAKQLLFRKAEQARALLTDYLFEDDARRKKIFGIEFFPGTSRALEAGLLRIGDIRQVVLSQYEHPSQVDVARWLCDTHGVELFSHLKAESPSQFQRPWHEQEEDIVTGVLAAVGEQERGRAAVILSEVHYLTGIQLALSEIIERLRAHRNDLVFVVDASQAVGNLQAPLRSFVSQLRDDDFYYFSAHKWLLSPNTCGVLISQMRNRVETVHPYDAFGLELPTSTIDPNTVFGLVAALEFLFGRSGVFSRLHELSLASREYFRLCLEEGDSGLEIVESSTTDSNISLFVAVRPRIGWKWRYALGRFWDEIVKRGVDLTVVPETLPYFSRAEDDADQQGWSYLVRISFPYFLVGKHVRKLVRHLKGLVEKAN